MLFHNLQRIKISFKHPENYLLSRIDGGNYQLFWSGGQENTFLIKDRYEIKFSEGKLKETDQIY